MEAEEVDEVEVVEDERGDERKKERVLWVFFKDS